MEHSVSRRTLVGSGLAALIAGRSRAQPVFRLGLTPVFLDNDAAIIDGLRRALSRGMGRDIELVQRRTYQEITGLLLERSVDAAWLCGYPYLQHADFLDLVAVPVWRGGPRYQSYLIVGTKDGAEALSDLQGGTHAFSDPDSNSGYLVTATDLRRMGEQVDGFFSRSIFTFGHRNVVRAVADGLVRSGSVDGYVWEALAVIEPGLTARTRVIARSEWLGFPPVCARRDSLASEPVQALQTALMSLAETEEGRQALNSLQLDGFQQATPALFDGIADRMADLDL
ncbi:MULTISPECIES: PhnD/SsuA/transferrin family substrate-binding protein [Marivita]|uniref:PhnD/SsuA/transferrin family substrate-binding protein n=1 Tax=Marivita cryptomonadis TaxID=505252 RepID=A0A9Q2P4A3_9RHOB|nr:MULTISPECIES: PhnD/SsuA/transferrin family substrate-binding protein [Marivita]MBM2324242.1 PhnD/SsuA/transferrin family substrate-binding protein [Marivita cryptomonadis]MBM2333834.1 PhnD/SsuA/transferrin family substrate-binding protein [Marivita cryptomonadis]MBM2343409.1 PhnD/SsuA/transferrin family substrate-binding protein [Marivita cryptomonadis]MBM2348082.1 PhnD/SsuA/transferrin family substrate-binding protein [Marivita cryptomonadis]MBM2352762.1 PhnD/SsuA/transferrin family substr